MNEEDLIARGKEIAQEVVNILRAQEGLETVEIMVGLYILQDESSVVPGRMVAKTLVSNQSSKIKSWEEINERYYYYRII